MLDAKPTWRKRDRLSKIPLLFENRFYAIFRKSVKWYITAVANIHASQIDDYEKQLDVSLTSHCSNLYALLMLVWKLSSVKLYFFECQQVFISVELSCRRDGPLADILCTKLYCICFIQLLDGGYWVRVGCCNGSWYKKLKTTGLVWQKAAYNKDKNNHSGPYEASTVWEKRFTFG